MQKVIKILIINYYKTEQLKKSKKMKYRNLILLAILSINLVSCDDEPIGVRNCKNPEEATQEGKDIFSFYKNGDCYKASYGSYDFKGISIKYDTKLLRQITVSSSEKYKDRRDVYDIYISMYHPIKFSIFIKDLRIENNIVLYDSSGFSDPHNSIWNYEEGRSEYIYVMSSYNPQKLLISRVKIVKDAIGDILFDESFISGTFATSLKERTKDSTVTNFYTDGRFDVKVGIKK